MSKIILAAMTSSRVGTLDPAPPQSRDGGGGGRWAWLFTAGGIVEAELARGALEGSGVPVILDRRDPSPFAWMHLAGNMNAPVQLYVPASLLDNARLTLLEAGFDSDEPTSPVPAADARTHPVVRWTLLVCAILVTLWIVLFGIFGSVTCSLRMVC